MVQISDWIVEEFSSLNLGDKRLVDRCRIIMAKLSGQCQASIPVACRGWAEIKAAYRFFENEVVTLASILAPHFSATRARIALEKVVILPQDTTELDVTNKRVAGELGPLSYPNRKGWLAHLSVAFTLDRVCLGVVHAFIWTRDPNEPSKNDQRKKKTISEKESKRWLDGYQTACDIALATPDTQIISVADRECDIYEMYVVARGGAANWIVRSSQNRSLPEKIADGNSYEKLWTRVGQADILGESVINIPARGGRARRNATLTARSAVVTLRPPYRQGEKLEEVTVHAVLLREETPANGIEPLEWLLLTDLPVNTWEEVQFVINGYLCRWQIECFFKVLKSGCKVENLQLQTPERFLPCLGLYLIISWRVLYLTMLGRSCPSDLPCTLFFDEAEWKAITMIETKKLPETPPTLTEMVKMIAQQGSYVGRKGDGNPGIVSIWVGLQRVMDYARAWTAFGPERYLYEK